MSDAVVGVTQGVSPDRLIDNESLTVGVNTVYRQRLQLAGSAAAEVARVENAQPGASDYGLVVRSVGNNATTAADGSNVALGNTTDASSANTVIGRLKALILQIPATLGRTTMVNSLSVAIASDQAAIPVTTTDGGSVAIGTTTDTSAANTVIGRLKALVAQLPGSLGRTTMAGSLSVAIASDQAAVGTSSADGGNVTLGTTTDAASANTVIGRLKTLIAQHPAALGRTTMAGSLSVAIASDQANVPVNNAQVSGTTTDVNTGVPSAGTQRVVLASPAAAAVLAGYQSFSATTAATTLVTVPAGKTWQGTVSISAACGETAAGTAVPQALGVISVAGTGVTPAAGSYFGVEALSGANAATGTVGSGAANFGMLPMIVIAPGGNSVTIQVTVTVVGSAGRIDASAFGTVV